MTGWPGPTPSAAASAIASRSLQKRLVQQDLRHRNPSTFFRGIGAVLEYRPQAGSLRGMANQKNYKFSRSDTGEIVRWIDDHLRVWWCECEPASLADIERSLIRQLTPLMNTTHNPAKSEVLAALRKECREIAARGPPPRRSTPAAVSQ